MNNEINFKSMQRTRTAPPTAPVNFRAVSDLPTVPETNEPVIIAFDPSITAWGWAAVNIVTGEVIGAGCIKTSSESKQRRIRKGDDRVRRVAEINEDILRLHQTYDIQLIVTEQPHGSQSAVAAVMIGIVIGMIQTFSQCMGIPVEYYSEGDSKNTLLKKRSATKDEMKEAISKHYKIPWTGVGFRDEAIADAMAVFHCATKTSSTVQYLLK